MADLPVKEISAVREENVGRIPWLSSLAEPDWTCHFTCLLPERLTS